MSQHYEGLLFLCCIFLGIIHEHQRPDRNDHVFINFDNIDEGADGNFYKYAYTDESEEDLVRCTNGMSNEDSRNCWNGGRVENLGVQYDPQSLVHYSGPMFEPLPDNPDQVFGGAKEVQEADHKKIFSAWGECFDFFKDTYM